MNKVQLLKEAEMRLQQEKWEESVSAVQGLLSEIESMNKGIAELKAEICRVQEEWA